MKNKCENMYCEGHSVKCSLTGLTLGDIIGYDGKVCTMCQQTFIRELIRKLARTLVESRPKNNKQVLNYMYGKGAYIADTQSDCDFCRNAYTCDELNHDNDLCYKSCGETIGQAVRMLFKTGDNRKTELIVEHNGRYGWETIAVLAPNNCPFCGRPLDENATKYKIHMRG